MNKHLDEILKWLEEYKTEKGCRGVVLGISGGKDSTTVAMLSKKIWGDNVLGVLMPNGVQADLDDSRAICEHLKIRNITVNIGNTFGTLCDEINRQLADQGAEITPKTKTNIPPRLRMTTLYAIAQSIGYRVIGTGNASEAFVGWTTKFGDSACDFNPIRWLTCTEVINIGTELAEEFGLPLKYIQKAPSDGLSGKTDEDNFGFTYDELDEYITQGPLRNEEINEKIGQMHKYAAHKTRMPYAYFPDDPAGCW